MLHRFSINTVVLLVRSNELHKAGLPCVLVPSVAGSTMPSMCRSSFTCQVVECRRANMLYSPAINALEHDRIAIQQHVECDNPRRLRKLPESQKEQRD